MTASALPFTLRPLIPSDRAWVHEWMVEHWGSALMAVHDELFRMDELPGLAAELDGKVVGLVTYRLLGDACELMSLDSLIERRGIGGALIGAMREQAAQAGCRRLRLTTTNDNLDALRFYQKRGFRLVALHPGAVDLARRTLKPEIPLLGDDGIPIRDEIELEEEFRVEGG